MASTLHRRQAQGILLLLFSEDPEQVRYGFELARSLRSAGVYRRLFSGLGRDAAGVWSLRWGEDGMLRRKVQPWGRLSVRERRCLRSLADMLAEQWGRPAASDFGEEEIDILLNMSEPWPPALVRWFWRTSMVSVSAGTFDMTLPRLRRHSGPKVRAITISQGFSVMRTPVTQHLYASVMGDNPSQFPPKNTEEDESLPIGTLLSGLHPNGTDPSRTKPRRKKGRIKPREVALLPVESVTWGEAIQFCQRLSERLGCPPGYQLDQGVTTQNLHAGMRLPTRAEWCYFAAAGESFQYPGSDDPEAVAWSRLNAGGRTRPVGQLQPNGLGLYDVSGNVFEWCWDWYRRQHRYGNRTRTPIVDPTGPSNGFSRLRCGGAWSSNPWQGRVTFSHTGGYPYGRDSRNGFRPLCVATPPAVLSEG